MEVGAQEESENDERTEEREIERWNSLWFRNFNKLGVRDRKVDG